MSNDGRIEDIPREAIKELEKISLLLDSDPELIDSMSSDELRNEMREIGLDFHKPLVLFPSLDSSLPPRLSQVGQSGPERDFSPLPRTPTPYNVGNAFKVAEDRLMSEFSNLRDRTIGVTKPERRLTNSAPALVDSFGDFLRQVGFERRLKNLCKKYSFTQFGGAYEAEDLYQDCVLTVWKNKDESPALNEIENEGRFFSWLSVVVRNQYLSKVRQCKNNSKEVQNGDRMYPCDVVQIVDVYSSHYNAPKRMTRIVPEEEALGLSRLIKPLGRNARKIAIVAQNDEHRIFAYEQAGFEICPITRDRPTELRELILQMTELVKQQVPKHTVLVSDDLEFVHFCREVAPFTDLAIWANSSTVPHELTAPHYGWRPLEELLPNMAMPRIDVRIDLENIFIGLAHRGWSPNVHELIGSIRTALEDLGEVVSITGYADFDELNRHHRGPNINWQRELALAGAESRYVINQRGKNTADMKIVDDIRSLVEINPAGRNAIDIIVLASMDRDFVQVVNTARFRGKRVVVLGVLEWLSHELELAANEVRYLDNYLKLSHSNEVNRVRAVEPSVMPLMTQTFDGSRVTRTSARPLRVFLSHSSGDKPIVKGLYQHLRAKGIEPWLDEENIIPGQVWAKETLKAVRDSDIVIVSLSRKSIDKAGYIQEEINFALDVADEQPEDSIFIIPAKLEPCEVPERLKRWEGINLYEEKGYQRLLDTCIDKAMSGQTVKSDRVEQSTFHRRLK